MSELLLEHFCNEKTTLTAFFQANNDPGDLGLLAHQYTYQEFPQHFTWKENQHK
jgi:hypothetical protein